MNKVKFSDRHHSVGGVLSIILGGIAIAVMIAAVIISFIYKGNAPLYVGAMGMSSFLFNGAGLVIGLLSFKESDKYYNTSIVGSMMCGIFAVVTLGLLMMGF